MLYILLPQPAQTSLRKEEINMNKKEIPSGKKLLMSDSCCLQNGKNCLTHLNTEATLSSAYVIVA